MLRRIAAPLVALSLAAGVAPAVSAVTAKVPNNFVRNCSYITRRCTPYWQTNSPYNASVTSRYTTNWVLWA